jgi:hypothetical protein
MFMLLSITGLSAFGILNVNAPNYGGPTTQVTEEGDKPKLLLTVLISKKGFYVAATGAWWGSSRRSPTPPRPCRPSRRRGRELRLHRAHRVDGEREEGVPSSRR